MDRTKQGISKSQVGFFDIVALPLFTSLAQVSLLLLLWTWLPSEGRRLSCNQAWVVGTAHILTHLAHSRCLSLSVCLPMRGCCLAPMLGHQLCSFALTENYSGIACRSSCLLAVLHASLQACCVSVQGL